MPPPRRAARRTARRVNRRHDRREDRRNSAADDNYYDDTPDVQEAPQDNSADDAQSPEDILKERLALGEITIDEYNATLEALNS